MVENRVTQRVAAVLAADAAGYTRLMADVEPATIDALDAARAVFIESVEAKLGSVVDMRRQELRDRAQHRFLV